MAAGRGPAAAAPGQRPPGPRPDRRPVRALAVLYDDGCRFCAFAAGWLSRQRQLVPLTLVPVGSPEARTWFPGLDHDGAARREVTVVGDGGQVYVGDTAWVVCLWALADHRAFSHRLTTPAGRRLARAAVLTAARYRERDGGGQVGLRAGGVARTPPRQGAPVAVRHPAPTRTPAPAPTAAPAWEYDGRGGWTLRDDAPPTCTDGCSPPG